MISTLRLRFFFDAGSGCCLWAGNDAARDRFGYAVASGQLPVSVELRARLDALVARHDTSIDWNDPAGPSPWSSPENAEFDREARALVRDLRRELGPDFEIADELPVLETLSANK